MATRFEGGSLAIFECNTVRTTVNMFLPCLLPGYLALKALKMEITRRRYPKLIRY